MPHGLPELPPRLLKPPPRAVARKPWWQSWTLMANALVLALAIAELQLGVLQAVLPVNVYAVLAFAMPIVNGLLRLRTHTGIRMPRMQRMPSRAADEPQP